MLKGSCHSVIDKTVHGCFTGQVADAVDGSVCCCSAARAREAILEGIALYPQRRGTAWWSPATIWRRTRR